MMDMASDLADNQDRLDKKGKEVLYTGPDMGYHVLLGLILEDKSGYWHLVIDSEVVQVVNKAGHAYD